MDVLAIPCRLASLSLVTVCIMGASAEISSKKTKEVSIGNLGSEGVPGLVFCVFHWHPVLLAQEKAELIWSEYMQWHSCMGKVVKLNCVSVSHSEVETFNGTSSVWEGGWS